MTLAFWHTPRPVRRHRGVPRANRGLPSGADRGPGGPALGGRRGDRGTTALARRRVTPRQVADTGRRGVPLAESAPLIVHERRRQAALDLPALRASLRHPQPIAFVRSLPDRRSLQGQGSRRAAAVRAVPRSRAAVWARDRVRPEDPHRLSGSGTVRRRDASQAVAERAPLADTAAPASHGATRRIHRSPVLPPPSTYRITSRHGSGLRRPSSGRPMLSVNEHIFVRVGLSGKPPFASGTSVRPSRACSRGSTTQRLPSGVSCDLERA